MVMCAGPLPPNPGELVASGELERRLRELEGLADLVLVDSPAFLAVGDAASLAKAVSGLLLVVNIRETRRPTLRETRFVLDPLPCRKLGLAVVGEHLRRAEYYRYGYYTPHVEKRSFGRESG